MYDNSLPEINDRISPVYLHFASLYAFFAGKLSNIEINVIDNEIVDPAVKDKRKKIKIKNYLSEVMGLPIEFFNSMYSFFMLNT